MSGVSCPPGVQIFGQVKGEHAKIITYKSLSFLAQLQRHCGEKRLQLLEKRKLSSQEIAKGNFPGFPRETKEVREGNWVARPPPEDLLDRRVEITGPVSRKMVINALNSGAKTFMADFEDSHCPTWENNLDGQVNLRDAVKGTISFYDARKNKNYQLKPNPAVLLVRPRGWHLDEAHIFVDGRPMSGSLFDFGLYVFHNAQTLISNGSGPYFYLPKLEHYLEARLWNDAFVFAQEFLNISIGTMKATVLIETILAAFQMDEIIYELREHSIGLNCGRWDYIFSMLKKFGSFPEFVLPDRGQVGMDRPFMDSYVRLLIKTCHRRGVHAVGGMAAFIPIKNDQAANEKALNKVRRDKLNEVTKGHDGTWVAHPGLVKIAMDVFDKHMPAANQISKQRSDVVTADDLYNVGDKGTITMQGLKTNIGVSLEYIEAWIRGIGCIPVNNLMEDAATAEISRCQVWQWIQTGSKITATGESITKPMVSQLLDEELSRQPNSGKWNEAGILLRNLMLNDTQEEFLTLKAYQNICYKKQSML